MQQEQQQQQSSNTVDAALDEAISYDERWIELYQAELSLFLRSQSTRRSDEAVNDGNTDETVVDLLLSENNSVDPCTSVNDGSALDWILQLNSNGDPQHSVSKLLKCAEASDTTCNNWLGDRLQPMFRNFCFSSVYCRSHNSKSVSKQRQQVYTLQGYFLANRLVHARIRMVISLAQDDRSPSIVQIRCELVSNSAVAAAAHNPTANIAAADNSTATIAADQTKANIAAVSATDDAEDCDWSWLQNQVEEVVQDTTGASGSGGGDTHYLAAWISCVSEYLEFDKHRREMLLEAGDDSLCTCGCLKQFTVQHVHSKSVVRFPIYSTKIKISRKRHNQQQNHSLEDNFSEEDQLQRRKPSHILSIVWGWRWKERRAYLRLTQESAGLAALRQPDLDQLVQACHNDCWQAVQLLLTHCSGCSCWRPEHEPRRRGATFLATSPLQRPYLQDPVHDADDEGDDEDEKEEDSSNEPFRLSPSGRRRSDYEVQRLERVHRNEQKLIQLGLLWQSSAMTNGKIHKSVTYTKKFGKVRRIIPKCLLVNGSSKNERTPLLPRSSSKLPKANAS